MPVVHISSYRRRGGLRRDQIWVERAFPERHWVITAVVVCEDGQRRVVIEPVAVAVATSSQAARPRTIVARARGIMFHSTSGQVEDHRDVGHAEGQDDETAFKLTIDSVGDIEQTLQEVANLSRSLERTQF